jgi:hypothetical protein
MGLESVLSDFSLSSIRSPVMLESLGPSELGRFQCVMYLYSVLLDSLFPSISHHCNHLSEVDHIATTVRCCPLQSNPHVHPLLTFLSISATVGTVKRIRRPMSPLAPSLRTLMSPLHLLSSFWTLSTVVVSLSHYVL